MGRWGEEEKKTKGLGGCFIAVFVVGFFSYFCWVNYEGAEKRRALEKMTHNIVTDSFRRTDQEITGDIRQAALNMNIELAAGDIKVEKWDDGYGNFEVKVNIAFPLEVNLLVTKFDLDVPIVEKVTLIEW